MQPLAIFLAFSLLAFKQPTCLLTDFWIMC